jgi:uncharacterized membrane protein YebE (DUF533 family)
MFDAMKLLGTLLESQGAPSAANRLGAAAQQGAQGGGLQDVLGQLLGGGGVQPGMAAEDQDAAQDYGGQPGGGPGGGLGGGGGLGDALVGLLGGLLGGQGQGGQGQAGQSPGGMSPGGFPQMGQGGMGGGGLADILGGVAGMLRGGAGQTGGGYADPQQQDMSGGGLGSLAGAMLGGGRGAAGGAMVAILAGLAQTALQSHLRGRAAPAQPEREKGGDKMAAPAYANPAQAFADPAHAQHRATLILRSMIQAAKADGQVDQQEMQRIAGKLDEAGEDRDARDFVMRELSGPADIDALCRSVQSPQEAVEVYAAALMAIEVDTAAEQAYLDQLAGGLGLEPGVVAQVHQALGVRL